jgi:hypothetical protein
VALVWGLWVVEGDMREARCLKVEGMALGQQRREKLSVGVEIERNIVGDDRRLRQGLVTWDSES